MIQHIISRFVKEEKGQALVEYSILLSIAAFLIISVLTVSGQKIQNTFSAAGGKMDVQLVAGKPATPIARAGVFNLPSLNFSKVKMPKEDKSEIQR